MSTTNRSRLRSFSLIEVVIATAVFATAIVAIIGLMSPLSKRVDDIIDSETANRLAESIQIELSRIGFATAVALTGGSGTAVSIELVANTHGDRVRLLSGGSPAANNLLDDANVPGIADRDRYFLVTLTRLLSFSSVNSGSVPLRADVAWPFQLPVGPATATIVAHGDGADDFRPSVPASRQTLPFFFALTP